jgi:hypothetical protein
MKNHIFNTPGVQAQPKTDLHKIADYIIKLMLPAAVNRGSFIINDIPGESYLEADKDLVAIVLSNLLLNTISSSSDGCIRVSSHQENGETFVTVKDNNSDCSRYISGKMAKVQPIVKKMGGDLRFELTGQKNLTIIMSFGNSKHVA